MFPCPKAPHRGRAEGTLLNLTHYRVVGFLVVFGLSVLLLFCFDFLCLLTIKKHRKSVNWDSQLPLSTPQLETPTVLTVLTVPSLKFPKTLEAGMCSQRKLPWRGSQTDEEHVPLSWHPEANMKLAPWNLKMLADGQNCKMPGNSLPNDA